MAANQVFLLVLLGLWCVDGQYQFFQMVQQWGPAKCSSGRVKCHVTPKPMFTIHGLWPSNFTDLMLHYCSLQSFDASQIKTLQSELSKYWPDVVKGKDVDFWKHEWEKHGTCSNPPFNIFQYFELALNIRKYKKYDLMAILNNAGLHPSTSKLHQYDDIADLIQAAVEAKPLLKCNDKNGQGQNNQLWEVILCFDHGGVNPIDCPAQPVPHKMCVGDFKWQSLANFVEGEESLGIHVI